MKKHVSNIKYNEEFRMRSKFVFETALSVPIGAIAAFLFDNKWTLAFTSLIIFLILYAGYCIYLVSQDSKVSILSIMQKGLKDGRYEDVIKFGSAMSPTLFTSNKNFDRVTLGRLLLDACKKLSQTEHSARDDIMISTGGTTKPVKQIKIELLLDDLGWSLYLADSDNNDATSNIQEGIKNARLEIQRIVNGQPGAPEEVAKKIEVYMKLILRGYRHLTGIYYTKSQTLELAKNYERITQYILSGGKVLTYGGACSARLSEYCGANVGGMICKKVDMYTCIINNIKQVYFSEDAQVEEKVSLNKYIEIGKLKISERDLIQDKNNFLLLSKDTRLDMLREQSYAWSRNSVKLLQRSILYGWSRKNEGKKREVNEIPFVSDEERNSKLTEARAFARLYFYGEEFFDAEYDESDFDKIIASGVSTKKQQRYLSLLNEITMLDVASNKGNIGGYDDRVEALIRHINDTRDACRGLRADLFARNTGFLIKAYLLNYNLNYRYNMGDESTRSERAKRIKQISHEIKQLREEVNSYEHADNDEVKKVYRNALCELKACKKELRKWRFGKRRIWVRIPKHYVLSTDNTRDHLTYADFEDRKVISTIKERWKVRD